jgi:predicted aldo/keto reductase-like oxidoreductase
MDELISALNAPAGEKDYTPFLTEKNRGLEGQCVYCSHCQPCPADIDIAGVNRVYDAAALRENEIPPGLRARYKAFSKSGADCVKCGSCEERCPFGVRVMERMDAVVKMF